MERSCLFVLVTELSVKMGPLSSYCKYRTPGFSLVFFHDLVASDHRCFCPAADKAFPGKRQCFPGQQDADCWQAHGVHRTRSSAPLSVRKMSHLHWPRCLKTSDLSSVDAEGHSLDFTMWTFAKAFFRNRTERPWWLIAPLITTTEETVNRDKDESVSGLFKEKVPSLDVK